MNLLHGSVTLYLTIFSTVIFLTGCHDRKIATISPSDGIPKNAIHIGDQIYMVPLGKDSKGCLAYRGFSPKAFVGAPIFYKGADGKFVTDRRKSDCK